MPACVDQAFSINIIKMPSKVSCVSNIDPREPVKVQGVGIRGAGHIRVLLGRRKGGRGLGRRKGRREKPRTR